eukprot:scaffold20215_cov191-Skeletonema_marinoi.AAC.1
MAARTIQAPYRMQRCEYGDQQLLGAHDSVASWQSTASIGLNVVYDNVEMYDFSVAVQFEHDVRAPHSASFSDYLEQRARQECIDE